MGYVALIPLLPMVAFAILAPLPRKLRTPGRWLSVAAITGSLGLSVAAFFAVWPGGHDSGYWHSHMRQYLAFYARHCA